MGREKDKMMEKEERGWRDPPAKHVCATCTNDEYLARLVRDAVDHLTCDYCGQTCSTGRPHAAPLQVLVEAVGTTVNAYWTDPAEELPFESAEGGYQGEVIDSTELLSEYIGVGWNNALLSDVVATLTNDFWCKRHYFTLEPDDRLVYGWRDFEKTTTHEMRYAALLPPIGPKGWDHPDSVPASEMLDEVADCIRECGLVQSRPVGSALIRARAHAEAKTLAGPFELGAPTPSQAKHANRMSAAGIAVFYGALDENTAIVETFDSEDTTRPMITLGVFRTMMPLNVLNLCDLPPLPSYFDVDRATERYAGLFLRAFAAAVSRPTSKDERDHIEYVPTQIFAEFIRHRFRTSSGEAVHGVLYPSARMPKGRCGVLFCDQSACGVTSESGEQWLKLDDASVRRISHADCVKVASSAASALYR